MSTDLIKSIQSSLATIIKGVDEDTRAVAGAGGGNKRISIKGGVFRKFVGGKEVGSIEDRHMDVIFVKMAHDPSRTYYAQGYREGERAAPVCWSTNSKTPDADVPSPPARSCESCPFSVKGSGHGGTGTACRLQWRTAVVLPSEPDGDVMQLVLPPTSAFGREENGKYPFRAYMQMLANHNISGSSVITKMSFDTKSPVPRVLFQPVAAVSEETLEIVREQGKGLAAENAVKLTVFKMDEPDNAPPAPAPVPPPPAPAKKAEEAPAAEEESVAEPVVREVKKPTAEATDVPDVVRKWARKKKED